MLNLEERIRLIGSLKEYLQSDVSELRYARQRAREENAWFTPDFVDLAISRICERYLNTSYLASWVEPYRQEFDQVSSRTIGIVMAGNIPLVGFHDFLSVWVSGRSMKIKPSTRDQVLPTHLISKLLDQAPGARSTIQFAERLLNCDAYIATGNNNSARYFDYYFAKWPHIIRRNRSSVAVLDGTETPAQLAGLADDIFQYFGLGCRNVSKLYVPKGYDFRPLLESFGLYQNLEDHSKYRNNLDYNLSLMILNRLPYLSCGNLILVEHPGIFSPIGVLHYEYYPPGSPPWENLQDQADIQAVMGSRGLPLGSSQSPGLRDYADGVNTLAFLAGT